MTQNPYASPASASAVESDLERQIQRRQARVDHLLTRGMIFSIVWLLGFGSIYSVYLGVKAHRIIRNSKGAIQGLWRVWWCYLVGGVGILFFVTIVVATLINQ